MEDVYGAFDKRQPISEMALRLKSTFKQLKTAVDKPYGKKKWKTYLSTALNTFYCRLYFKTHGGKAHLKRIVQMSDTLVIDGRINTVISGTIGQRTALVQYLDELEQSGLIVYGSHISSASVMSCYVRDAEYGHVHFVDGAEGGYTQAATILKRKVLGNN
jgi:hypothetical protein